MAQAGPVEGRADRLGLVRGQVVHDHDGVRPLPERRHERLLDERQEQPGEWAARQERGVKRTEAFSWSKYAREIASLYEQMADRTVEEVGVSS